MKELTKKLFLILLAMLPCFATSVMAEDGTLDDPEEIPVKPGVEGSNLPRPRARSRSRSGSVITVAAPECYYYNGVVSISAGDDIYYINATVIRSENNQQWNGSSAGNELFINVSTESGTYILELTLSNRMTYYGEYNL